MHVAQKQNTFSISVQALFHPKIKLNLFSAQRLQVICLPIQKRKNTISCILAFIIDSDMILYFALRYNKIGPRPDGKAIQSSKLSADMKAYFPLE